MRRGSDGNGELLTYVGLWRRSSAFDHRTVRCPTVVVDRTDSEDCRESDRSLDHYLQCWISVSPASIHCWKTASLLVEKMKWSSSGIEKICLPSLTSKAAIVNRTGCSVTISTDLLGPRGRPGRERFLRRFIPRSLLLPQMPSEISFKRTIVNLQ